MYQNTLISRNSSRGATLLFGAGVALAASALFGIAEPAVAQGTDADNAMDEIIVTTARRREESLMDVPLSISVIGGVDLERVGAVDIIEIAHDVVKRGALIVIFVDCRFNAGFSRDDDFDIIPSHKLDIVDGEDIGRVGHSDDQRRACTVDRNQLILLHDFGRN